MKRALAALVCIIMLLSNCCAESLDLAGMSFDDLVALQRSVNAELMSRAEANGFILAPGEYIAGKEIKPGNYYILFDRDYDSHMIGYFYIYDNADRHKDIGNGHIYSGGDSAYIKLEEGNLFVLKHASAKISVVDFSDEVKAVQVLPDNVKEIPTGMYIIGEDFPAGKYDAFVKDDQGGEIDIYATQEDYSARKWLMYIKLGLENGEGRQSMIKLEDGNVFVISEGPLYMRKTEGITFD